MSFTYLSRVTDLCEGWYAEINNFFSWIIYSQLPKFWSSLKPKFRMLLYKPMVFPKIKTFGFKTLPCVNPMTLLFVKTVILYYFCKSLDNSIFEHVGQKTISSFAFSSRHFEDVSNYSKEKHVAKFHHGSFHSQKVCQSCW